MGTNPAVALWVTILMTIVPAVFSIALVQFLSLRALRFAGKLTYLQSGRRQQFVTLIHVLQWGATLGIGAIAMAAVLGTLGLDLTPLIAGAGVAGLAVSMAAQSLLKDILAGVLLLVENQFVIGEVIKVGEVAGTVERVTLRATYVRDFAGNLFTIPNGDIRVLSNMSRDWARAIVDLRVAVEEDIDRVLDVLLATCEPLSEDEAFGPGLLEPPKVAGPLKLEDNAFTVRVTAKTQSGKQWGVASELQRRIHMAFARERIALPQSNLIVWPVEREGA